MTSPRALPQESRASATSEGAGGDQRPVFLDADFARERFTNVIFSDSHGAFDGFLGVGYLYYGFAAALRSQVSVCIGSGGGFVPDILSQVQRDLGISPAATYLIDASLPDLGFGSPTQPGGWMRPENDFLLRAYDVRILSMLSADAAKLFARQGVAIDYLHIDGDHSTRGVIADFEDFAPLLSKRAIVSLHDLNLQSVRRAMGEIEKRFAGWEILTVAEVGVGTAFMRRISDPNPIALPQSAEEFVERHRKVNFAQADVDEIAALSAIRGRYERWQYLETDAYRSRYQLIAPEIDRPGGVVVEIGGFPNSVVDVLTRSARVYALEPFAPETYLKRIKDLARQKNIEYFVSHCTVAEPTLALGNLPNFALVWLGLDVTAACDEVEEFAASLSGLIRLAGQATVVAIELPDYVPSALVWQLIRDCLAPAVARDITLDLSADPVGEEFSVKDGRAKRRILIFRATHTPGVECNHKIQLCAERLRSIKQRSIPNAITTEEATRS